MEKKMHKKGNSSLQVSYVLLLTCCFPISILHLYWEVLNAASDYSEEGSLISPYTVFRTLYIAAICVLGIANIIQSFQSCRRKETTRCINRMLVLKYGLVIFFMINFILIASIFLFGGLMTMVISRGTALIALPLLLPWLFFIISVLAFVTWLLLLPGAFYGVQVIRLSYSEKKLGLGAAVLHGLLQFCFLADVLDAMYLSVRKWGIGKKSAVLIGILYLGTAAAAIWMAVSIYRMF